MAEFGDEAGFSYIGSRLIVLTTMEPEDAAEGLLVVYHRDPSPELETKEQETADSKEKEPQGALKVRVGTNNSVYSGEIDWARVKLADKTKLSTYLLTDGSLHPDITVRIEHDIGPALRLTVQERVASSGNMKFAYVGKLDKDTGSSPVLHFCNSLSQAVDSCGEKISRLQKELINAKKAIQNWKDTAQKLDVQVWQREKDRLVNNFVTLWNERQRRAKEQFQELKEELEATKAALKSKTTSGTKRPRTLLLDEEMAADDLAANKEPIPLEEVAALAAGKRLNDTMAATLRRKPILKADDVVSAATLKQQAENYRKRKGGEGKVVSEPGDDRVQTAPTGDSDEEQGRVHPSKRRRRGKTQSPGTVKDDASARSQDSDIEAFRAQIRARVQETRSSSASLSSSETDDGKGGPTIDDHQSDASF